LNQIALGEGGGEYREGTAYLLESPNPTQKRALTMSYATKTHTLDLIAYELELYHMLQGPSLVHATDIHLSMDPTSSHNNLILWREMPFLKGEDLMELAKV
jgi:hypothetical protein